MACGSGARQQEWAGKRSRLSLAFLLTLSACFLSAGLSVQRPFIATARASYLDDVAKVSQVMNQFVDALLEKVSFLAEIIIESSTEESCEALSCGTPATTNLTHLQQKQKQQRQADRNDSGQQREGREPHSLMRNRIIGPERFDSREFTNVHLFLDSFNGGLRGASKAGGGSPFSSASATGSGSCKLFKLNIERRDLPVSEMELCCLGYDLCYGECGKPKLKCDSEFQLCLKSMCKQKFDYTKAASKSKHEEEEQKQASYHHFDRRKQSAAPEEPAAGVRRSLASTLQPLPLLYEPEAEFASRQTTANASGAAHLERKVGAEEPSQPEGASDGRAEAGGGDEKGTSNGGVEHRQQSTPFQPDRDSSSRREDQDNEEQDLSMGERKRLRDKYKACRLASKVLIIGNLAFGCQTYKEAQWRACCGGDAGKRE